MREKMGKKLLGLGDVKVLRERAKGSTHYFISVNEMRRVLSLVGDNAYVLYSYYRTGFFTESTDFEDKEVSLVLGWARTKVQKYRLILENANLFHSVRYGTKQDGMTKVFVGEDIVALFNAGMPADVLDSNALNKLKKEFGISSGSELVERVAELVKAYEDNPSKYK